MLNDDVAAFGKVANLRNRPPSNPACGGTTTEDKTTGPNPPACGTKPGVAAVPKPSRPLQTSGNRHGCSPLCWIRPWGRGSGAIGRQTRVKDVVERNRRAKQELAARTQFQGRVNARCGLLCTAAVAFSVQENGAPICFVVFADAFDARGPKPLYSRCRRWAPSTARAGATKKMTPI